MKRQRGAALMVILMILGVVGAYFAINALNNGQAQREQETANTMAQAKDTLIGYAVSRNILGYLPAPDLGTNNSTPNEGDAAGNFTGNAQHSSIIGRFPWRTLGLLPLKDSAGECLWYAVSGAAQSNIPPAVFNWDSIGHFDLYVSPDGTLAGAQSTSGGNPHNRPLALIMSPGPSLGPLRNTSATDTVTACGGNYSAPNYLDSPTLNPRNITNYFPGQVASDVSTLASPKPFIHGKVENSGTPIFNDRILAITPKDLFNTIKKSTAFKNRLNTMLLQLEECAGKYGSANPPSATNKGIDGLPLAGLCEPPDPEDQRFLTNWRNNLFYTQGGSIPSKACDAVIIFSGERTASQRRSDATEQGIWANYLEDGTNATSFPPNPSAPGAGAFTTPLAYSSRYRNGKSEAEHDLVRCISFNASKSPVTKSFASNANGFVAIGAGVTPPTYSNPVLTLADAPGTMGGCAWFYDTNPASLPNSVLSALPVPNNNYQIQLKIKTTTPGTFSVSFGGVSAPDIALALPGTTTHALTITAKNQGHLTFTPSATWLGEIDDISLIDLGTGMEMIASAQDRNFGGSGHWRGEGWFIDSGAFSYPRHPAIPLAGRTLRAYYEFAFTKPDTYALTGTGTDRGYGFSLQMVRSDFNAPPTGCGAESNMGVLTAGAPYGFNPNGTNPLFGQLSYIFETDVRRTAGHNDPAENHSAIMVNGTLDHSLSGSLSTACDATASGCRHNPANTFEENLPLLHTQRVEITTGCNATCSACTPASHGSPNTHVRINTWVDCKDCSNIFSDIDRVLAPPTTQRCLPLASELGSVYFGFTGGFLSGAAQQGVSLRNFYMRSE